MRPDAYDVDGITGAVLVEVPPTNQLTVETNHSPHDAVLLLLFLHVLEYIQMTIIQTSILVDNLNRSMIEFCT